MDEDGNGKHKKTLLDLIILAESRMFNPVARVSHTIGTILVDSEVKSRDCAGCHSTRRSQRLPDPGLGQALLGGVG